MPLSSGTRLGPYEVVALIGEGGMGQVYRATDTRLNRTVALKVLPAGLTDVPDRRERFEREAHAIGALNHPNICTLHDIGRARPQPESDHGEVDFLVMEHVEGETVADRLTRGGTSSRLEIAEVLACGIQIADALDRAHRQGIVHRDLKPGNIMLTKSGIKLLDFGLAKMLPASQSGPLGMLSTQLANLTTQGTIVGTLQYMAPEQVEGRQTDARTDIFAFGAVLHEMATGEKAFEGRSQASVIAAILDRDPPPISTRQTLAPAALDRVVATCLAKDPDDRWQTARDLGRALRWIAGGAADAGAKPMATPTTASRTGWWLATAALAGGVLGAALVWQLSRPAATPARDETRFSIELPFTMRSAAWQTSQAAISRDGRRIVYRGGPPGQTALYFRSLNEVTATRLVGTEGAENPFFASDGEAIGFYADQQLKRVSLGGGRTLKICDAAEAPLGASWYGETVVFATAGGLAVVPASGGTPRPLTTLTKEVRRIGHRSPVFLPGGAAAIYVVAAAPDLPGSIEAVELSTGARHVIVSGLQPESRGVQYLSSGHLLYEQNDSLLAVRFDPQTLKATGAAVSVAQGVATMGTNITQFAVSESGTLIYVPRLPIPDEVLTWVTPEGQEQPIATLPAGKYRSPRISPDGTRLSVASGDGTDADILVANLATGAFGALPRQKPSFGPAPIPLWTPDGASLTYAGREQSLGRGFMIQPTNRSAAERVLFRATAPGLVGDGTWARTAAGDVLAIAVGGDIWRWSSHDGTSAAFVATPAVEGSPALSSDGRWLAYASSDAVGSEIWVRPFPADGPAVQVSAGGGTHPAWGPGNREIFYVNGNAMMAATVTTGPSTAVASSPRKLFESLVFQWQARGRNYDVDPKTGRFLVLKSLGGPSPPAQLVVVVDWMAGALARMKPRGD
jgi:eukaryotic-like serine/threonine-protein kinase